MSALTNIKQEVEKALGKKDKTSLSRYQAAKQAYSRRRSIVRNTWEILFLLLGVGAAGFGLKGFLIPNNFIDGGVTGISLLTHEEVKYPLALFIILFNIPFIILGWHQINKVFGIKSIFARLAVGGNNIGGM